jgi:bifunctional DNase/RNase
MVEVVLRAVRVDVGSATPLLLLEEIHGSRVLPVFIGTPEATAIAYALEHVETPRPMTHDLMDSVIDALGARLSSVEVTGLEDHTYIAELHLHSGVNEVTVSARPSDAIALALRSGAPILVNDELMAAEGQELDLRCDDESEQVLTLSDEEHEEHLIEEMRLFLDSVSPRDFEG